MSIKSRALLNTGSWLSNEACNEATSPNGEKTSPIICIAYKSVPIEITFSVTRFPPMTRIISGASMVII